MTIKSVRVTKPPAPWLTHNLSLIMRKRDMAVTKYRRNSNVKAATCHEKTAPLSFLHKQKKLLKL